LDSTSTIQPKSKRPQDWHPEERLAVFLGKLRKTAWRYGYRGLKIFAQLLFLFKDFQRWRPEPGAQP
jgi:hypothetical protein